MSELTVYIGRFNPFHSGHAEVISRALSRSKNLIILVGSSGLARSIKNPFTYFERKEMIEGWLNKTHSDVNVRILPLYDYPYNDDMWIAQVQELVETEQKLMGLENVQPTLIGSNKDESTWYLQVFGNYFKLDLIEPSRINGINIDATKIRDSYLDVNSSIVQAVLPDTTVQFLQKFAVSNLEEYTRLKEEYKVIKLYKASWSKAPYAPTFITVDAVIVQSGHILVVTRDAIPGKGLWALPGGFVEQSETLEQACLRELKEETSISLADAQLKGSIETKKVFDAPGRSSRGRTITVAFKIKLNDKYALPKVKGREGETSNVQWIPISSAMRYTERWFEDHHSIITEML